MRKEKTGSSRTKNPWVCKENNRHRWALGLRERKGEASRISWERKRNFQQAGWIQDTGQNAAEVSAERLAPLLQPVVEGGGFKIGIQERAIVFFVILFLFSQIWSSNPSSIFETLNLLYLQLVGFSSTAIPCMQRRQHLGFRGTFAEGISAEQATWSFTLLTQVQLRILLWRFILQPQWIWGAAVELKQWQPPAEPQASLPPSFSPTMENIKLHSVMNEHNQQPYPPGCPQPTSKARVPWNTWCVLSRYPICIAKIKWSSGLKPRDLTTSSKS